MPLTLSALFSLLPVVFEVTLNSHSAAPLVGALLKNGGSAFALIGEGDKLEKLLPEEQSRLIEIQGNTTSMTLSQGTNGIHYFYTTDVCCLSHLDFC